MLRLRNETRVFQFQVIRVDEIPPLIMISARRPSPDPMTPRSRGVISKASSVPSPKRTRRPRPFRVIAPSGFSGCDSLYCDMLHHRIAKKRGKWVSLSDGATRACRRVRPLSIDGGEKSV